MKENPGRKNLFSPLKRPYYVLEQITFFPVTFTRSKSTKETLEIVENIFKVKIKTQNDVIEIVLLFLLLTLSIFHTFF